MVVEWERRGGGGGDHVAVGYRFWYTGTHTNLPPPVNILMIFVCLFLIIMKVGGDDCFLTM